MNLADDPAGPLDPQVCAKRGAVLARAVFESYAEMPDESPRPALVIGSEVPVPGGSSKSDNTVTPTAAEDFLSQVSVYKDEFSRAGLDFNDVAAFVVQPGVEFGDDFVCLYDPEKARALTTALRTVPGLVFEGHSTDYQCPENLADLVRDGVAILKVGPAMTFALREGLFLLEAIEEVIAPAGSRSFLKQMLLEAMDNADSYWKKYYSGSDGEIAYKKLYSYSDRCRYYLPAEKVQNAVETLMANCRSIPPALLSQYFPFQYRRYMAGMLPNDSLSVICDRIGDVCDDYAAACGFL
jgi:D-tagatose-1,6-bisphosphate aldolase subunit GatZ/KbaZ